MAEFKVGCSPLTNKIYAGVVLKSGIWAAKKHEVTDSAVRAVAEHLLNAKEKLCFSIDGRNYELSVQEVFPVSAKKVRENG